MLHTRVQAAAGIHGFFPPGSLPIPLKVPLNHHPTLGFGGNSPPNGGMSPPLGVKSPPLGGDLLVNNHSRGGDSPPPGGGLPPLGESYHPWGKSPPISPPQTWTLQGIGKLPDVRVLATAWLTARVGVFPAFVDSSRRIRKS